MDYKQQRGVAATRCCKDFLIISYNMNNKEKYLHNIPYAAM